MFGLMTRKAHEAEVQRLNVELAKAGNRLADERRDRLRAEGEASRLKQQFEKARDQVGVGGLKFNKAVQDLALQAEEIETLKKRLAEAEADCTEWKGHALRNRDDAERFRAKAARDAENKRAKRAAAKAG